MINVNDALKRTNRMLTLNHPNSVEVAVYRKFMMRDKEAITDDDNHVDNDDDEILTIGGAGLLSNRDEADFETELLGAGKMLFLDRMSMGEHSGLDGLGYSEGDVKVYIEPIIEDEFSPKKQDRVFWLLPDGAMEFEIKGVFSPTFMPDNRLSVYILQPLEMGLSTGVG